MTSSQDVKSAVLSILEDAAARGAEIPSIRTIRSLVGKGSFGTISEVIKTWRVEQLKSNGSLPQGFDESDAKLVVDSVWSAVQPILVRQIKFVEEKADARVNIERSEAAKIREAAEEALATAEEREKRIEALTGQVTDLQQAIAKLQGTLDEARRDNERLRAENAELHINQDKALQEAARASAELASTRKLLPFLNPKLLEGTDYSKKLK